MPSDPSVVEFAGSVSALLASDFREQLGRELEQVFRAEGDLERILVSRCFSSYTPKYRDRVVLGVEVRRSANYRTYIVKVGKRKEVEPDYTGWNECTSDRQIASRIFSSVRLGPDLPDDRIAVLYRDAYTLFGLDRERSHPETLETVAEWAMLDDRPDPLSLERAIAHMFTDLGRWFYPGAQPAADRAIAFYRDRLRFERDDRILPMWQTRSNLTQLRRDIVWLACGRDKPDADPENEPARYLDPVDLIAWMLKPGNEQHFPDTLVGRSHGDVHGRNILVGVRRGEVEYPAVFDYGEMRKNNVLAWDFAKLESELKVRLLPAIIQDEEAQNVLLDMESGIPVPCGSATARSLSGERALRIAMFYAFEQRLHDLARRIYSRTQAEALTPLPSQFLTGSEKLDRLFAILLRIRKEAAIWLGFEHHQRREKWRDEFYFALAVHGLLHARWDYDLPQSECALVAAGIAAARMPMMPSLLRYQIDLEKDKDTPPGEYAVMYPSYRVPLFIIHDHWKGKRCDAGRQVAERTVLLSRSGRSDDLVVRSEASHAIPLIAEAALLEVECKQFRSAEAILDQLRATALEFGDFETLGRLGRLYKDVGDRRWDTKEVDFQELKNDAAWQMYSKGLAIYEAAFQVATDYYTGINAATLALLTGETDKATKYANQVLDLCRDLTEVVRGDRFWVFATEGEASLILKEWKRAEKFYRDALTELTPGQGGMANSSYKQLCRLWKALGDKLVPILEMFEKSEFRDSLTASLGRQMVADPTNAKTPNTAE